MDLKRLVSVISAKIDEPEDVLWGLREGQALLQCQLGRARLESGKGIKRFPYLRPPEFIEASFGNFQELTHHRHL
ncbi:Uu.00g089060.m01.CDS01 [Anthostomella pinea]|uniref:Uu.00g089060.m01.CDS01 n=1 Tax=Anthostomella pinea TaxID=933095 RepID=A0AAI8VNU0_9PEZI|nr:Uu.00g089060.m01.CDS01 [Anthostomella pinea]